MDHVEQSSHIGEHHCSDVLMVMPVGKAIEHCDGGQGFQD